MNVSAVMEKVDMMNAQYFAIKKRRRTCINEIKRHEETVEGLKESIDALDKTKLLIADAAKKARVATKEYIEKAVTDALQFVTQSTAYEFVMQENSHGGTPTYDIFIKTTVDGNESLQNPEDSNGGGYIDTISVAIKSIFLQACNDPDISHSVLYLDEPGKMISEQMSVKFAEFIKLLNKKYGLQVVMITHNKSLANIADRSFLVEKGNTGSKVSNINTLDNIAGIVKADVLKIMEGEQDGTEQNNDQAE